jgi:hypothetical protein
MPTPTYTPLATVTLGSSASSVTFSSIPATYRDLVVVFNGTVSTAGDLYMTLNSDTTNANYSFVRMVGSATATSQTEATREIALTYTDRNVHIIQVMDYSATDKHKTSLSRSNGPANVVAAYASRYASTSAITSVGFTINGGHNFETGATFALYGIAS